MDIFSPYTVVSLIAENDIQFNKWYEAIQKLLKKNMNSADYLKREELAKE